MRETGGRDIKGEGVSHSKKLDFIYVMKMQRHVNIQKVSLY